MKVYTRRVLLRYGVYTAAASSLFSSLWVSGCRKGARGRRPNVVLIVLDTTRADRFSCAGYELKTTPSIDALAKEGIVYDHAYSTNFWTLPSHASLFTGLYPSQAGATSETIFLPRRNRTLAEILKESGYETSAFVCNAWVSNERGFSQGFDEYNEMWRAENQLGIPPQAGRTEWAGLKKVLMWLEEREATKKPFFVFVNFNSPHLPYNPPEPFWSTYFSGSDYNNEEVNRVAVIAGMWDYFGGKFKLGERDFHIMSDLYNGEMAFADHCVGQITERLKQYGMFEDTVVVVTSDHGENLGEHGMIDHLLSMYETTLHVPLVIRYPGRLSAGGRVSSLVSLLDVAPTILDLCDISSEAIKMKFSGASLVSDKRSQRAYVIAENERPMSGIALMKKRFPEFDTRKIDYRMRAIRTDRHKLIWNIGGKIELFDLQTDPAENNNLADSEVQVRDKLHQILTNWMYQMPAAGDVSFMESKDKESVEILRSLGYVE